MPGTQGSVLGIIKSWGSHLATLVALGAIAWFGHDTHWTFIPGDHAHTEPGPQGHSDAQSSPAHLPADADSRRIVSFESPEAVVRAGIETARAEHRSYQEELIVNGVTSYDKQFVAQLSSRVPGTVWRAEKHQGDAVKKGEVLVIVESEDVGGHKAEFLAALVSVEVRRESLEAIQSVGDAVPGRQVREARAAVREAEIRLLNAEQSLANLGFELTASEFANLADEERRSTIRLLNLPEHVRRQVGPEYSISNMLPLRAPFDGVVISRDTAVGEVVEPSRPVYQIADVRQMWILLNLRRDDARRVQIGQPVRFQADGIPREIHSRVSWISTEVDERTRTLTVRADFLNEFTGPEGSRHPTIRANVFGTGFITVMQKSQALMVPDSALHLDQQGSFVFVQTSPTVFEARRVRPGTKRDGWVEIEGDVPVGALLAARGSHSLKSEVLLSRLNADTTSKVK